MTKTTKDFSFAEHAEAFDRHIGASISGYRERLTRICVSRSRNLIQPGTNVYDAGCSSGRLLRRIEKANRDRSDVTYIGIDHKPEFSVHWIKTKPKNISFEVTDVRQYRFKEASLIVSHFLVQFIPPKDKTAVLRGMYDGLVDGGALHIAEKTYADSATEQDAQTFLYYDYKQGKGFSPAQILEKERSLRGFMTPYTEGELRFALQTVGFRQIHCFWRDLLFAGYVALK